MIRSKYQYKELKVSVRNIVKTSGRNVRKDGTCQIYTEIVGFYLDGTKKTRLIPTEIFVNPKNFKTNGNSGEIHKNEPDYWNKDLKAFAAFGTVTEQLHKREQGTWDETADKDSMIDLSDMFPKSNKTLTNYLDDYIEYRKSNNTPRGTLKEFTTCKNRLIRFEDAQKTKLNFDDIGFIFSDKLAQFLRREKFMEGTIHKTFTILVTFLNHYYDRKDEYNIKLSDIFRSRKFKAGEPSKNDPEPLSIEELRTLALHKFASEAQNKMKDRFLFQCNTGARYSDAFILTPANIIGPCIEYKPVKTVHKKDNRVICPLNDISKRILSKYDNDMSKLKISNQKYNAGLFDMFNVLIEKYPETFKQTYTSHNGRDTFITNCLENGIDVPTLLTMVGQESYATMKRYYKPTRSNSIEKMKRLTMYNVEI
jgi:site-specific recombinase XerD